MLPKPFQQCIVLFQLSFVRPNSTWSSLIQLSPTLLIQWDLATYSFRWSLPHPSDNIHLFCFALPLSRRNLDFFYVFKIKDPRKTFLASTPCLLNTDRSLVISKSIIHPAFLYTETGVRWKEKDFWERFLYHF